jgi:hypothetical protein
MKCFPSLMHLDLGQLREAPPSVQVWHLSCPFPFYTVRLADDYGRVDPLHNACRTSVLSISLSCMALNTGGCTIFGVDMGVLNSQSLGDHLIAPNDGPVLPDRL